MTSRLFDDFFWLGQYSEDLVEQVADAASVLGGDRENIAEAEAAEVLCACIHRIGVHLVDGEKDGLAATQQQAGEFEIGRSKLGAPIDDHDDRVGFFERHLRLAEDLRWDQRLIVGNDAAGIDDARFARPSTRSRRRCGRG